MTARKRKAVKAAKQSHPASRRRSSSPGGGLSEAGVALLTVAVLAAQLEDSMADLAGRLDRIERLVTSPSRGQKKRTRGRRTKTE